MSDLTQVRVGAACIISLLFGSLGRETPRERGAGARGVALRTSTLERGRLIALSDVELAYELLKCSDAAKSMDIERIHLGTAPAAGAMAFGARM